MREVSPQSTAISWERELFHPFLIIFTGASLICAFGRMATSFVPAFPLFAAHPAIIFLISLEACITARYSHSFRYYRLGFHLREWLVIGLVLEAAVIFHRGGFIISQDQPGIIHFLEALLEALIFNPVYLLNLAVLYLSWRLINLYVADFFALELLPGPGETSKPEQEDFSRQFKRAQFVGNLFLYRRIVGRFIKGAMLLAVTLALYWRVGERYIAGEFQALEQAIAYGMVYLVLGLLLASRAHYLKLRVGWLRERIRPPRRISACWNGALAAVVLPFSLLAFLLPVVHWPLSLKGLAEYITYWVGRLFRFLESLGGPEAIQEMLKRRGFSTEPGKSLPFIDLSNYITLLAILMFLFLFAFLVYLACRRGRLGQPRARVKPELVSSVRREGHLLLRMAKKLLLGLIELPGLIATFLADLFAELGHRGQRGARVEQRIRKPRVWRGESPIARLYVRFLQLMDKRGLKYGRWMTAYEFADSAAAAMEGGREDIWFISQKFVETRYGRKSINKQELKQAASCLKRLRALG